jgi:uncharacterized protein YndB with AHSA1/START domain
MMFKILLGLGVLVFVLAAVIAMQPSAFRVERSATIHAPSSLLYGYLAAPRAHEAWSPFMKMDPAQKNSYSGPASGVGAICSWEGGKAGEGRMTVVEAKPDQEVAMKLEFVKPMRATNRAVFTLVPAGGGATTVTWRMEGNNGFLAKAFGLVMDMDAMVGGEFAKGLAALKTVAESGTVAPSPAEG